MRSPEPPHIEHHRVTVIAEGADLSAAPPRIEGVMTPFYRGDRTHLATVGPLNE